MAHEHKRIHTEDGQRAIAPARLIAMAFPEVTEGLDAFHHISFRIRNKPFVMMGEHAEGPWLAIKADVHSQAWLIKRGGFSKTPYIGQHGWVSVDDVRAADWRELEELITDAYLRVAPKRLAAKVREETET